MKITSMNLSAQPMLYVTQTVSMAEIPAVMNTAFAKLGQFLQTSGVKPAGPPLAVYHDWSGDQTEVDIGFPVAAADAHKANDNILAGMTPDGFALKFVHIGPYDDFRATYDALGAEMRKAGIAQTTRMWEIYISQPGVTPDAELVTEIYMQVTAADAAKYPAG